MMGLDNPLHILFLLAIVLLVFGAKRLPEMGRSLGSGMREFKQAITGEEQAKAIAATVQQSAPTTERSERVTAQPAAGTDVQ